MDVVEMVLSGRVNKGLVTLIQQAGGRAVGVCGKDSGIIRARMVSLLTAVQTDPGQHEEAGALEALSVPGAALCADVCKPSLHGSTWQVKLEVMCSVCSNRPHPVRLMTACHSQMAERGIGFVGDITSIQPGLIRTLVEGDYIPVVASVAADFDGQALNVNADIAAGEVSPSIAQAMLGREWAPNLGTCLCCDCRGKAHAHA